MRSSALLALWALSTLSQASDLPLDEAIGLAKRVPIVAAPAPTVVIRSRHMSDRRRHHARRARQQTGAADAGAQQKSTDGSAQQQGSAQQASSSNSQGGNGQDGQSSDAQASTDAAKSDSSNNGGSNQNDNGAQSQNNGNGAQSGSQNGQDGQSNSGNDAAQSANGNADAQSATDNTAATSTQQQDQAASTTPAVADANNQQSDAQPTRTDIAATAEQTFDGAATTTSDRRNRNGNDRNRNTDQATTSRTDNQRVQAAKQVQATPQAKFGQKKQTAPAATPAAKAGNAAAAGAAAGADAPGAASLAAAISKQLAGQASGFSASSSALAAKFTAASDNNFGGKGSKSVSQDSLTLDKSQVNIGSFSPGNPAAGQANSLTSKNNFINFCATQKMPLMNGLQQRVTSCNPIPMGVVVPVENAPTVRWAVPVQGQTLPANKNITMLLNVKNIQAGVFVDAQAEYFSAPQTVNDQGLIIGHGHFVINQVTSCTDTTPADPAKFVFFKGIDTAAVNGQLSATVINGLPAGSYRACSMMSSANHQPVLVSLAQRNNQDDCVCFFTK